MAKLYNKDSIESLSPLQFTRLKPQVYCGNTEYATQLLVEIVSNSVDEWRLGHGNQINVALQDNYVEVRDFAQGFLTNEVREDGKTVLEAAFSVLNTSGKYREDGTYEGTSLGSFGIGSKLPIFLSHSARVQTWRDGKTETIYFKEGEFVSRDVTGEIEDSGTKVSWYTSEEFFDHPIVDIKAIRSLFHTISCLCPGLRIVLNDNGSVEEYYSENGLDDYVDAQINNKELLNNRMRVNYKNGKYSIDLVLTYAEGYSATVVPFVNCGLTDSGSHITTIKSLVTREFNKFFKSQGWLKEKDDNLAGEDINEGLYIAFNITAPSVAYDAQVKSRVTKIDMSSITEGVTSELQSWLLVNEKEIKKIFDKAAAAKKAREAAKKAREAARGVNKKEGKKKVIDLPTKLVDCWSKDRGKCELLIAEGDSAASGLVEARDAEFQAIFPIRGKIIAAMKTTADKVYANQEVVNIIKALGLSIDPKTNRLIYSAAALRYGKILMCVDADSDGANIANLLLELFWWLCPELVTNGHIYATRPPLFRITTSKNEYVYLRDAAALVKYTTEHSNGNFTIGRNKGLGESDAEELREFLVDPATRNIAQIVVKDKEEAASLFECLCGKVVTGRKAYLLEHSKEAKENKEYV